VKHGEENENDALLYVQLEQYQTLASFKMVDSVSLIPISLISTVDYRILL
jgi:hypothetical protein